MDLEAGFYFFSVCCGIETLFAALLFPGCGADECARRYQLWPRTKEKGEGLAQGTHFVSENQEPAALTPN